MHGSYHPDHLCNLIATTSASTCQTPYQIPGNNLVITWKPPGNHLKYLLLLYKPGREDDDTGLQVFGLQQQSCQVGVRAEQQHLLRLEDRCAGRQVMAQGDRSHRGTLRNTAEQNTTEHIIGHALLALNHQNPLPIPSQHLAPMIPASTMLPLTHATMGGGWRGQRMETKSVQDLLN